MKESTRTLGAIFGCLVLVVYCHAEQAFGDGEVERGMELIQQWTFNDPEVPPGFHVGANLKPLRIVDGRLRVELTGDDAYFHLPNIDTEFGGVVVRLTVWADTAGEFQVYWRTNEDVAFTAEHVINSHLIAGRLVKTDADTTSRAKQFRTLDIPIGQPQWADRRLAGLRIDPVNNAGATVAEFDSIEIWREPSFVEAQLSPRLNQAALGETIDLQLHLQHMQGAIDTRQYKAEFATGTMTLDLSNKTSAATTRPIRFDEPGVHSVPVSIYGDAGKKTHVIETSIVAGEAATLPIEAGLQTGAVRLDFVPTPNAKRIGAARWLHEGVTGGSRQLGWLLPLAQIVYEESDGTIVQHHPDFEAIERTPNRWRLHGQVDRDGEWNVELTFEIDHRGESSAIRVKSTLKGPDDGRLLDFSGPMVRLESRDLPEETVLDRYALLPGLDYVGPGLATSTGHGVGEHVAARWAPHPHKITVPVMSYQRDDVTLGMMWDPHQRWNEVNQLPGATFASPDLVNDQPQASLMRLSAPSIPGYRNENSRIAQRPYRVLADRPMQLEYVLFAQRHLPIARMTQRWFDWFDLPAPPPTPHDDATLVDLIVRNYADTMYWSEQKGWRQHWFIEEETRYVQDIAAFLVAHAAATGETKWIERTNLTGRTIVDIAGSLADELEADQQTRESLSRIRPDGTWGFSTSEKARQLLQRFTQGRHTDLGEEGSTAIGLCAQETVRLLRHALISGDRDYIEAGLDALDAMRQFRIPRGAQTWEVHIDIPDIRASALATEAYHLGYQLTGDERFLDEANEWAWTGVPFVFSWRVPVDDHPGFFFGNRDRDATTRHLIPLDEVYQTDQPQVTPYGTIPVFGTSVYTVSWFGVLVQWCGLEWAQKVIALDEDWPDPTLRYIADGVIASGFQQMMDREPWVGLLPDGYHLEINVALPALIYSGHYLKCLRAQDRVPAWEPSWSEVLRNDTGLTWHVSGWGSPEELASPSHVLPWEATLSFVCNETNELLIVGIDEPQRLLIDGNELPRVKQLSDTAGRIGWHYERSRHVLLARFIHETEPAHVRIHF